MTFPAKWRRFVHGNCRPSLVACPDHKAIASGFDYRRRDGVNSVEGHDSLPLGIEQTVVSPAAI